MLRIWIFTCLGMGVFLNSGFGQNEIMDLTKHIWKDRVLLICSSDTTSAAYQEQLDFLTQNKAGLKERKLKTYVIQPDGYFLLGDNQIHSSKAWNNFNKRGRPFLFQLIGLDGGVKLTKEVPVLQSELFALIDGMPMRRAELRKRQ